MYGFRWLARHTPLALLLAAASCTLLAVEVAAPAQALSARGTAASGAAATAVHASATTPSAAVQLFASEVETLGAYDYPSSFAGATITSAGVTDVYALKASDAKLVSAINALNKFGYPVSIIGVSRSYNQLNALTAALGNSYAHLKKDGVRLVELRPDPSSGSVVAAIAKPAGETTILLHSTMVTR
jgi:hypothetical protein